MRKPHRIKGLLAALGALSLGVILAGPASASSPAGPAAPSTDVVTSTVSDGAGDPLTLTVRALSADEIKALGLNKYVDMSKVTKASPHLLVDSSAASGVTATPGGTASSKPEAAVKPPAAAVSALATHCWSSSVSHGRKAFPSLYYESDVHWCGDGTWINYANSNCWGQTSGPTWNYESCNNYTNYGTGWNIYQVRPRWTFCIAYVPWIGSCAAHSYPWVQYYVTGSGKLVLTGNGS